MTELVNVARSGDLLQPSQRSLPELTLDIQRAHGEVMGALANGAAAAIRAGHALVAAKLLLKKQRGHGFGKTTSQSNVA